MSREARFFWCDEPSPLHQRLSSLKILREKDIEAADAFARSVGASVCVFRRNVGIGLVFPKGADVGPSWIKQGEVEGETYYMPRRNTEARKKLYRDIGHIRLTDPQRALRDFGLDVSVVQYECGHTFLAQSRLGFKDDRIFVRIPVGESGDSFPDIPAFLAECKEWEYQRWFLEGRAAVEGSK